MTKTVDLREQKNTPNKLETDTIKARQMLEKVKGNVESLRKIVGSDDKIINAIKKSTLPSKAQQKPKSDKDSLGQQLAAQKTQYLANLDTKLA